MTTWYAGGPGFDLQHSRKLSVMMQPVSLAGGRVFEVISFRESLRPAWVRDSVSK